MNRNMLGGGSNLECSPNGIPYSISRRRESLIQGSRIHRAFLSEKRVPSLVFSSTTGGFRRYTSFRGITALACFLVVIVFVIFPFSVAFGADFAIDAQVDKTEIKAGESLNLTVTVTQNISAFGGRAIGAPRISSIPGFDIVGQRSAQNMSFVNGAGMVQISLQLELVPQREGTLEIPVMTLNGPDGKAYSTKPITIVAHPPSEAKEDPSQGSDTSSSPGSAADVPGPENRGIGFFQGLLILAGIIALVLAAPLLLSWFMNRDRKPSSKWQEKPDDSNDQDPFGKRRADERHAEALEEQRRNGFQTSSSKEGSSLKGTSLAKSPSPSKNVSPAETTSVSKEAPSAKSSFPQETAFSEKVSSGVADRFSRGRQTSSSSDPDEPETVLPEPDRKPSFFPVDFEPEAASLKRAYPDVGTDFYNRYFDLFRRAILGCQKGFDAAMTPDELMKALGRRLPPNIAVRAGRLAMDWDFAVFARMCPQRSFADIQEDIREVLIALKRLER
ncbi:MAG: BatD family protein [Candidatus Ozemobacteraceae bacterium]